MVTTSLLIGAVAVLAVATYWLVHGQRARAKVPHFHRCSACGQRVRYQAGQGGRSGLCPCCRKPMTLPADPLEAVNQPTPERYRVRRLAL